MTQTAVIVLLLKVFLISGFVSLAGWVVLYSWLTRGAVWRSPIGQTLVIKSLLVAGTFLAIALPAFVPWFARHPLVMGWTDVGLIGAVTPVMLARSWIWIRLHRAGELSRDDGDGLGEGACSTIRTSLTPATWPPARPGGMTGCSTGSPPTSARR